LITTKNTEDLLEYDKLQYPLFDIICYFDRLSVDLYNKNICVTDLFRSEDEHREICRKKGVDFYLSVHMFGRGADIRSWQYSKEEAEYLRDMINLNWIHGYDGYQVCILHKLGNGAYHFHLQVSDRTRKKEGN